VWPIHVDHRFILRFNEANATIMPVLRILPLVLLFLIACKEEEEPQPLDIIASDFEGEWTVTSFTLDSQNNTSSLNSVIFEIYSNGDIAISNTNLFGSYEVDVATKVFTVDLTNPTAPSDAINGAWQLLAKTETTLTIRSYQQANKKQMVLAKR